MPQFKIKIVAYLLMTRCSLEESVKKEDKKNELGFFSFSTITKIKCRSAHGVLMEPMNAEAITSRKNNLNYTSRLCRELRILLSNNLYANFRVLRRASCSLIT